ncbi:hypothetical protein [Robiginitalea sediminis]|uniref:hypothetical protein n=1 Tax=Robiginitalea sediminis TaxID=1982593 RepID=UPI0013035FB8|nr:hypothetical protein [Robiginitalea sediminis]
MTKLLVFVVLTGFNLTGLAQHQEKEIVLKSLEIQNRQLTPILDSIVLHEKKCDYYNCKLTFVINVKTSTFNPSFTIESIPDRNLAFNLEPYGFFYNKGHLFIVDGDIAEELFARQKESMKFKFLEYDTSFEEYDSEGRRILRVVTDDSFTMWEYRITGDKIVFVSGYSLCGSEEKQ